jgi:hypothetical protein
LQKTQKHTHKQSASQEYERSRLGLAHDGVCWCRGLVLKAEKMFAVPGVRLKTDKHIYSALISLIWHYFSYFRDEPDENGSTAGAIRDPQKS